MARLTIEQKQEAIEAVIKAGGSVKDAAKALGIPRTTLSHRLHAPIIAEEKKPARVAKVDPEESLRKSVFRLAETQVQAPKWVSSKPKKSTRHNVTPILFASDFQWGETIRPEELDGINGYDSKIAARRLHTLFDRTIDICQNAMSDRYDYPGIVYVRGGDMVSGDIHQELRETNDLSSIPAVIDLVSNEIAGLKMLADHFGKVHVVSVCGNHGRQTEKPMHKRFAEANYDTLSAYMIEAHFIASGDKRFTFCTPPSGDALFDVYGWQFLVTHGDRIGSRGGEGFIGPAATIARGMKKTFDYYASLNRKLDYILVGHFHTALALEYGFSNGCLSGFSEYARSFRLRPNRPSQWLLMVNQSHGVMLPWQIYLEDRLTVSTVDTLPFAA